MHCPRCGALNAESATACGACGSPLAPAFPAAYAPPAAPRERPTGVSILAVLCWVGAGGSLLVAFYALILATLLSAFTLFFLTPMLLGMGLVVALGAVAVAGLLLATGVGLWRGRAWGWVLGLVVAGLLALAGIGTLASRDGSGLVQLAFAGAVGWYLFQPGVKQWFGQT